MLPLAQSAPQPPWALLALTGAGLYCAKLWWDDLRAAAAGRPARGAFPGAVPAGRRAVVVAVAGSLVLVAAETATEAGLGLAAQQTRMTGLFCVYSILAAPMIEELVFRGWLVVDGRGPAVRWAAAAGASVVFALLHPFLWHWEDTGFTPTLTAKGAFSTGSLFLASLWFYAARLGPWNPSQSLLPCLAAHLVRNLAVVAIKAASGHLGPAW